ncbi:phosphoenolpyruvate carboxykinase (ATP) [Mucilaginibacter sp. SP1R1]|uniref:phosphoenolpyruvate carboxykinase (ATP) n=1 Tax=Mucilaginibacter sp. SP1R1 TaxID=2723091 RepID=UPI00161E3595|nr:phosphoenolpyruvate carboxykinase (ATP) [Mucilaginibacter sp. SP1R1]MBB6149879.1 phosphoenolpyruvate carboxykinase (ATP) [Mucilaginibacter sp. SP1R1]
MGQITDSKKTTQLGFPEFYTTGEIHYQLSPEDLVKAALERGEGYFTDQEVLAIDTGEFTGRSPKDRFIVSDSLTENTVWWGDVNIAMDAEVFDRLYTKVVGYLGNRDVFVRDAMVCAEESSRLTLRVITETASQNLFAYNLFLRPDQDTEANWIIISAPGFKADPAIDGTRQHNFSILNFTRKIILIGGTGYTGEIKKAVFTVLNFILPQQNILPMHCAANKGEDGDTAIFFGLSGTGKTTLSADPDRQLIGDDEHGWDENTVFNFEGGCYAKIAGLSLEKEPQIYKAIKPGALLENVCFYPLSKTVDFDNLSKTENIRLSYPLHYISNTVSPAVGDIPQNIFFLTADAFGVLPPIAKLNRAQAMYYFLSGYTAKVAGTEYGINEPQATFSACFGRAFLPLHPTQYARMLGEKLDKYPINVWLVNTGWTGGSYGTGERINLKYTRAMIKAALKGQLSYVPYHKLPVFDLMIPAWCPGVPPAILNPVNTWADQFSYEDTAKHLARLFRENCSQYKGFADGLLCSVGPTAVTAG